MKRIFQFLARWPLLCLHALGAALGLAVLAASRTYRQRLVANARQSRLAAVQGWRGLLAVACQAGMMVAELPRVWLGAPVNVLWDDPARAQAQVDAAHAQGKSILYLTPHLGCWEVAAQAMATYYSGQGRALTVMYRPARKSWLDAVMVASRRRPGMHTVPADMGGIRQLLRVLKSGGAIGLLPDQVPADKMGVWANFFGRPAYTMTLAAKLAQSCDCIVLMGWCERLSWGRGYRFFLRPLELALEQPLAQVVQQMNDGVEATIARLPTQYLWGYARYKMPRG